MSMKFYGGPADGCVVRKSPPFCPDKITSGVTGGKDQNGKAFVIDISGYEKMPEFLQNEPGVVKYRWSQSKGPV